MAKIVRLTESDLTRLVRKILKENEEVFIERINNLDSRLIHLITMNFPSEYGKYDEEIAFDALIRIIQEVNPNVDIERKKDSLRWDWDNILDSLKRASWRSFSAERGIKDYFLDNLQYFN
jgi:hypothetical protein